MDTKEKKRTLDLSKKVLVDDIDILSIKFNNKVKHVPFLVSIDRNRIMDLLTFKVYNRRCWRGEFSQLDEGNIEMIKDYIKLMCKEDADYFYTASFPHHKFYTESCKECVIEYHLTFRQIDESLKNSYDWSDAVSLKKVIKLMKYYSLKQTFNLNSEARKVKRIENKKIKEEEKSIKKQKKAEEERKEIEEMRKF